MIAIMVVLSIFAGYVLTSVVLLRYPRLLHKPKEIKFKPRVIGHRGGAGENLENTLTAFKSGVKAGVEMLELDCQLTKDGEVVVCHDNCLERISGENVLISDLDYKDLPLLKQNLEVTFTKERYCIGNDDRRIPLLREIFETFRDIPINVDIKINNDKLIEKVSDLIKEFKREDITVWGNVRQEVVDKCYKENPQIPILFSFRRVVITTLLFYCGLLPFIPIKESFMEVLMPSAMAKMFDMNKKTKALWSIIDTMLMSKIMFYHLSKRGIQVYVWVLNEENDWERALRLGATGIMTDYPTQLSEFLSKNAHLVRPWA
ncbi:lysophospholipase D GDPD1-like [Ptychodera flava]|uniref:lysophospholipase D GDPD1-like n=1 Tax=Ptychodera flava TaxID=63121 RepID=UPI003969FB0E